MVTGGAEEVLVSMVTGGAKEMLVYMVTGGAEVLVSVVTGGAEVLVSVVTGGSEEVLVSVVTFTEEENNTLYNLKIPHICADLGPNLAMLTSNTKLRLATWAYSYKLSVEQAKMAIHVNS